MISRRRFVTAAASTAAALGTAGAASTLGAQTQTSSAGVGSATKAKTHATGSVFESHLRLIAQKASKLQKDPSYDPYASGEVAMSTRMVFEQLLQSGITSKVTAHIKKHGVPAVSGDFVAPGLAMLQQYGAPALSAEAQQASIDMLNSNGVQVSQAMTPMLKKHGMLGLHQGLHNILARASATPNPQFGRGSLHPGEEATPIQGGTGKPTALLFNGTETHPRLLAAATAAIVSAGRVHEPMDTAGLKLRPDADPDGEGGEGGGGGGEGGGGDGGDGDGGDGDGGDGSSDGDGDASDGDGDGGPNSPGDPDTEDSMGDITYENTAYISVSGVCSVLNDVFQFANGLSVAAMKDWAAENPELAASIAASLGVGVNVMIFAIGAIVGLSVYAANYACQQYATA